MIVARHDEGLQARITEAWELPGVRAGSGLAWSAGKLVVVQDDAYAVAIVDPLTRTVVTVALLGDGEELPKARKPDFEAIFVDCAGALVLIGSGSTPNRRCWARLDLSANSVVLEDMGDLYAAIQQALGAEPNLEGCVVLGNRLQLFHRADGSGRGANAILEVARDQRPDRPAQVLGKRDFDLGRMAGVALSFTDATAGPGGRIVYLAAAEDTPNAIDDGQVVGAAVGVIDGSEARWTPLLEPDGSASRRKVEGIALIEGLNQAYMVTDADDPKKNATLLRVALTGVW